MKTDTLYYAELIPINDNFILLENNYLSMYDNNFQWRIQLSYYASDINVYSNIMYLLSDNAIHIISKDGREKGLIPLITNYRYFVRISDGYYLYNEENGIIDFLKNNKTEGDFAIRLTGNVNQLERDLNDNLFVLTDQFLIRYDRNLTPDTIYSSSCNRFFVSSSRIYIMKHDSIFILNNGGLWFKGVYQAGVPIAVKGDVFYQFNEKSVKPIPAK